MTSLVASPHFDLTHDPGCDCLYATWHGPANGPASPAEYDLIVKFLRATRSTKLLNDGLADQNGWRELTTWLVRDCFQGLGREGLKAVAWVLPRDTVVLYNSQTLLTSLSRLAILGKPLVETFVDPVGAYDWLHQLPR